MKRFAWIVAVACVAGCSGLRIAESVPEGPTVLKQSGPDLAEPL